MSGCVLKGVRQGRLVDAAMTETVMDPRRRIPPVDQLLADPRVSALEELYGRDPVRIQVREELQALRERLAGGVDLGADLGTVLVSALSASLARRFGGQLSRVINATGIFLHTNLGRAPLPPAVATEVGRLTDAYCDLEIDLETGRRSDRNRRAEPLLTALTGAEAAVVTNNCAAALVLALAALARGREVVVSRGELVEIGGSFRIPEILEAAGVRLVEVGSTNRTRRADYERAIGPETGLLLKVFPSNYVLSGFVEAVAPAELAELAESAGLPLLVDEGSGLLRPHTAPQLAGHPSIEELIAAGCPLVCGSGDKLLGGPQAGLLAGRADLVKRCRKHPLYRAFRPGRSIYGALEAVLRGQLRGEPLPLDALWPPEEEHRARVEAMAQRVGGAVVEAAAFVGGGSAPEAEILGPAIGLPADGELLARLRAGEPPVVGYVKGGRLVLDLRTVDPADDEALVAALERQRA